MYLYIYILNIHTYVDISIRCSLGDTPKNQINGRRSVIILPVTYVLSYNN